MSKRFRRVEAKPGHLVAAYGRADDASLDIQYAWGGSGAQSPDARCVADAFERCVINDGMNLRQLLLDRGYDITTLRFSVSKLEPTP